MITQTQTRQQTSITTTSTTKKKRFAVLEHKVVTATRCQLVCADCGLTIAVLILTGGLAEALGSPRQPHATLETQADDVSMHSDEEEAARMSWEYGWEYAPPEADHEEEVNAAIEMTSNHKEEEEEKEEEKEEEEEKEKEVTEGNIHVDIPCNYHIASCNYHTLEGYECYFL